MIPNDSPLAHVHCTLCGREMRPGGRCAVCGGPGPSRVPAPVPRGVPTPPSPFPGVPTPEPFVPDDPAFPEVPSAEVPVAVAAPVARRASPPPSTPKRGFRPIDLWRRYLPPVRLVWLFLGVLVWLGGGFLDARQALPLVGLAVIGAVTDLGFQRVRFRRLRFPDAALATSLFVAIIIWPAQLDLPLASIAVASVGLRHVLRVGGHPIFNPAALGVTLATVLFAMPTTWHLGATVGDAALVAILGAILVVRAPHTWRFPVFYFPAYVIAFVNATFLLGGGPHLASLLLTGTFSAGSVFFGMFMLTEPRTAPSARWAMPVFAALVGVVAALAPIAFTEVPQYSALGVLAPFLALFVGNLFTIALPSARGIARSASAPSIAASGRRLPQLPR